jgi:hypothetical protein
MTNAIPAIVAKVTDPAYWCVGVVAGIGPLVVPAPYGYVAGSIVGLALVLGLARLERMDDRDPDDVEETARRQTGARLRKPMFARRVRFAAGRASARVSL